ncbi:calcium/sodium antiporter [Candidatus Gracilibacteria bacterium]|nr:calcium/sodium antiporter [Candidatus Gracilibacteria bacterium]
MLTYILFLIGFPLLIKGADILILGASSLALRYGIPSLVVGLTIVAFGTSAPELAVNIFSAFKGSTELIMGNIIGSNISNILLILGVTACIITLPAEQSTLYKEIPFSLFTIVLVAIFGFLFGGIFFITALFFLILFLGFIYYTYCLAIKGNKDIGNQGEKNNSKSVFLSISYIILGLLGLTLGGKWIVDGAIEIALSLGMSELVVGLTIVAIGTSLPELATSVIAAIKKETDIAIGNIVGSNIFNILLVLGVSGLITSIAIDGEIYRDIGVNILATILLTLFLYFSKGNKLRRVHGVVFLIFFILYVIFLAYISLT